jgi:4-amino-4-deoxy-L-arabinose transferase-like glycosyltransferase
VPQKLKYALFVLLLAFQCVYWGLGTRPIHKTQEIRVAETAREMVANGDWVTPYFNGNIRLRKPPLAYWLTAASYIAWDRVDEFTARFASATFGALCAFMLFFWLRRTLDAETALAAVLCFLSSYLALRFLRSAETDAILIFFVTAACITVYRLLAEGYTRARVLMLHAFMGLGFLTKGPAAIAIPLALAAAYAIKRKDWAPLRQLAYPAGLLLLATLAFGWYLAIYLKHANIAAYWVAEEVDATYIGGGAHTNPFYWYLGASFAFFAPWSLFIVPAAIWLYRRRPLPPFIAFAAVWFGITLLILSLNPAKQTQYALLMSPPLAILLGYYLASARGAFGGFNTWMLALILVGSVAGAGVFLAKGPWGLDSQTAITIACIAVIPILGAFALRVDPRKHGLQILVAGLMSALWIHGLSQLYGPRSDEAASKRFALAIERYRPLYAYGTDYVSLSFYVQEVVPALRDAAAVHAILNYAPHDIYVVGGATPPIPEPAAAQAVHSEGKLVLWRVKKAESLERRAESKDKNTDRGK